MADQPNHQPQTNAVDEALMNAIVVLCEIVDARGRVTPELLERAREAKRQLRRATSSSDVSR